MKEIHKSVIDFFKQRSTQQKDLIRVQSNCASEILGMIGRMITASKGSYKTAHPDNFPLFNANVCTSSAKIWYGDLDLVVDCPKLKELAKNLKESIYVLYEMDGRFEHENSPLIEKHYAKFNADGTAKPGVYFYENSERYAEIIKIITE